MRDVFILVNVMIFMENFSFLVKMSTSCSLKSYGVRCENLNLISTIIKDKKFFPLNYFCTKLKLNSVLVEKNRSELIYFFLHL